MGCASGKLATEVVAPVANGHKSLKVSPERVLTSEASEEPTLTLEARSLCFHQAHVLAEKLGTGAFAQVYAAQRHPNKDCKDDPQEVAVKIADLRVRPSRTHVVDMRLRSFAEKEALLLRRVSGQTHCVRFVDAYIEGHFSYLVMEKCAMSLFRALDRSQLTEYVLATVFRQMLQAIASIHALGIVHRDIKPDNFLCTGDLATGAVKLCDFGLAESITPTRPELKGQHGTAPFMSPEMLGGDAYATKTDVWSFGVVCYVLLLGKFPYQPLEPTSKAMKAAVLSGQPAPDFTPAPRARATASLRKMPVSERAVDFMRQLLDRKPEARPASSVALKSAWLHLKPSLEEQQCAPSLRSRLAAAKRVGAFSLPDPEADGLMEQELTALQAMHRDDCSEVTRADSDTESTMASATPSLTSCWEAASPCGSPLAGARQLGAAALAPRTPSKQNSCQAEEHST